jgi:cephalosporin hydroxylase
MIVCADEETHVGDEGDAGSAYHRWFYDTSVWQTTTWAGILTQKLPLDMWNYQEIIYALQPGLIVEFGRFRGGSTMFFAMMLSLLDHPALVFSVDIDDQYLDSRLRHVSGVELMTASSSAPEVADRIRQLRRHFPGPVFAILDSDHSQAHVYSELLSLRDVLVAGDYLIVEDGNINGHPVLPEFGLGPYEAIAAYFEHYPDDYRHDYEREHKFGLTFAVEGYLIRQ